jgi:hypothetical protein
VAADVAGAARYDYPLKRRKLYQAGARCSLSQKPLRRHGRDDMPAGVPPETQLIEIKAAICRPGFLYGAAGVAF